MKIFHGSQSVIKVPQYGLGKVGNDFGLGFYCTESEDLAKEWSVQPNRDGFANAYELDIEGLNILRLNTPEFTILNWMAITRAPASSITVLPIYTICSLWTETRQV